MAKIQVQIGMKVRMKTSPFKTITIFSTGSFSEKLYQYDKWTRFEVAKSEALVQWAKYENYKWVCENSVYDSITFHAIYSAETNDYQVFVTAMFELEVLPLYYLQFGDNKNMKFVSL